MSDIHFIYSVSVSACAAAHHSHRILANSRMVKCIYLSIWFVGSIRSKSICGWQKIRTDWL